MSTESPPLTPQQFDEQYRHAAPAVYAWISLRLGPGLRAELEPEDVLQEVACRAYARRDTYDPGLGPFRGWIFGIARNVLLQSLEQLTGRGRPDREWLTTGGLAQVPEEATSVTRRVASDDLIVNFLERVGTLPESERVLVLQRGLEGLSYEDVGQTLGVEAAAAAKRWERLRKRLQGQMTGLGLAD